MDTGLPLSAELKRGEVSRETAATRVQTRIAEHKKKIAMWEVVYKAFENLTGEDEAQANDFLNYIRMWDVK